MSENRDYPQTFVTTDIVLFTSVTTTPRVLLIRRKNPPFTGMHALPGGFLDPDETCERCAARELKEETGLDGVVLTQLGAYSDPHRDPRARTVSVVFFGIVDESKAAETRAGDDAAAAEWVALDELSPGALAFDHWRILSDAREAISA